jgi:hypothetical protein
MTLGGAERKRGGGGTDLTPTETGDASHVRAGEGEGKASRWAGPWGGVQLTVGREGMTGGHGPGKEKKEKENRFNSNLKLVFQIYSNLIRSKKDIPELRKFEINYGWKVFETRRNFSYRNFLKFKMDFELKVMEISMG